MSDLEEEIDKDFTRYVRYKFNTKDSRTRPHLPIADLQSGRFFGFLKGSGNFSLGSLHEMQADR